MKNINDILKSSDYDFLKTEERLKSNIDLLVFGGSISYGLDNKNSDIDIRGVVSPLKRDFLKAPFLVHPNDLNNENVKIKNGIFEQYIHTQTDTCIYEVNKYLKLIYDCNPNTVEMLGCLPQHYTRISPIGQLLLDNKDIVLTKQAFFTFSGYARDQLYRLQNALVGRNTKLDALLQVISVITRTFSHLEECFPTFKREMLYFYIVDSRDKKINTVLSNTFFQNINLTDEDIRKNLTEEDMSNLQLRFDLTITNMDPSDFKGVYGEISNVLNSFHKTLGHRNNKKTDYGIDKQASCLRRVQLGAISILRDHKIQTYCGDYIEELSDIKKGKYRNKDGTYNKEYFEIVDNDMKKIVDLYKSCTLPERPDVQKMIQLSTKINEAALYR